MWARLRKSHPSTASHAVVDPAIIEDAFERGRREGVREERHRRSHPIRNFAVALVALAGAGVLATAAWYGSFGRGGEVVDANLAIAADQAEPTVRAVVSDAGDALRDAGRELQDETSSGAVPDESADRM